MPDTEVLTALLARVEAAANHDGTLLIEVATVLLAGEPTTDDAAVRASRAAPAGDRFRRLVEAEAWTDAALFLVERVLPGWGCSVAVTSDGMAQATLYPPGDLRVPFYYFADCPKGFRAWALLAALLRAKLGRNLK